ncbi:hypothetical protein Zm00014a_028188 [Zea mays]|jgi:hypothetical protein|uniref:Uncharacterized protein n=1 Tax=Zea mays TaxID=4577 RepID=A0A317YB60_MAIZE|nr:hypothetical protein Zm00014a_028188 [Zea mays]
MKPIITQTRTSSQGPAGNRKHAVYDDEAAHRLRACVEPSPDQMTTIGVDQPPTPAPNVGGEQLGGYDSRGQRRQRAPPVAQEGHGTLDAQEGGGAPTPKEEEDYISKEDRKIFRKIARVLLHEDKDA